MVTFLTPLASDSEIIAKGSIGHAFTVCIRTENQNQMSFYPFVPHEISVLIELILGHLRYLLTDVPPQPNSPPDYVLNLNVLGQQGRGENLPIWTSSREGQRHTGQAGSRVRTCFGSRKRHRRLTGRPLPPN